MIMALTEWNIHVRIVLFETFIQQQKQMYAYLSQVEVIDVVEGLDVVALVGNDNAVDKYVVVNDDLVLDNYIHIDIVDVVDIHLVDDNWVEVVHIQSVAVD